MFVVRECDVSARKMASHSLAGFGGAIAGRGMPANVGARAHTCRMADIEIFEVRAFEARCVECGETSPIESTAFFAMSWEEAHVCVAVRIDSETVGLAVA